jgi:hypothetical protein
VYVLFYVAPGMAMVITGKVRSMIDGYNWPSYRSAQPWKKGKTPLMHPRNPHSLM